MRTLIILILAAGLLSGCSGDGSSVGNPFWQSDTREVWVAIEPTQCLTNPWEQDWLASHDNDYNGYPRDKEQSVIRDYYSRQGVEISDITTARKYDWVCLSCDCPRGDTLYLLVSPDDVDTMIDLGYRREAPAPWPL